MKKILIVNTSGLAWGGITTNMLNYIDALRDDYLFDIVVTILQEEEVIKEFQSLNCRIIFLPNRKKKLLHYILSLDSVLKDNSYDVLHVHGNSATMIIEMLVGIQCGIKNRISHCHNTVCSHPIVHKILNPIFKYTYTQALACSKSAGDWIFGAGNYLILNNAIHTEKFIYNTQIRQECRKEFSIDPHTILLGHVGNFTIQKNHEFLIELFYEFQKTHNTKLLLVGVGDLYEKIIERTYELDIQEKVIFAGFRNDVEKLMQAMDLFLLPSKWEGLPLVLIEAQSAGLPCVVSDAVTLDARLLDENSYLYVPLKVKLWINAMNKLSTYERRVSNIELIKASGYDIEVEGKSLGIIYNSN